MPARFFIPLLALFWLSSSAPAADMQWKVSEGEYADFVLLKGKIVEGDLQKLQQIIQMNKWKKGLIVAFDSLGGNVYEAVKIGRYIRQQKFDTFIGIENGCYSACFFSFIAGVNRIVLGDLGVHQFSGGYDRSDDIQSQAQLLVAMLAEYTASMDIHTETIRLASLTLPHEMYIFSEDELSRFNLFYTGASFANNYGDKEPRTSASRVPADGVFWQQDGWTVKMEDSSSGWSCSMDKYAEKNKGLLGLTTKRSYANVLMIYVNGNDILSRIIKGNKKKVNITLSFGGSEKRLILADYDKGKGKKASVFGAFLQKQDLTNIWNRNEMSLYVGRKLVDTISLKGSAKAFQALNRCYEMLP